MTAYDLVGLIIVACLAVYLFAALLKPQIFS